MLNMNFRSLFEEQPYLQDFFDAHGIPIPDPGATPESYFNTLEEGLLTDLGVERSALLEDLREFSLKAASLTDDNSPIQTLCIHGGIDKSGTPEDISITISPGDLLSIVGPTGAGKSRLLEDIECLAQGDTPTKRKIEINNSVPDDEMRFGMESRLVAQLSQNMNFVVDLSVRNFLRMHAESRLIADPDSVADDIYTNAIRLAGESFSMETAVTSLSGGQSRALMIADTARLSRSPIILIDEIENAGVDRNLALELLVKREKIVLLVTHDPELALSAPRRIVIRNGGISAVLNRTRSEEQTLNSLRNHSRIIQEFRQAMREGRELNGTSQKLCE